MTTTTTLTPTPIPGLPAGPAPAAATADVLALRREALMALDGTLRPVLRRRLLAGALPSFMPPVVGLTAYDAVYASNPAAGGHWTVATRAPVLFGHQVSCYTVVLEFDQEQRPGRFRVCGATEVTSDDATPESLDRALTQAKVRGPEVTWAPSFVPGISL